jgi:adenylate cyclase
VFISRAVRDQIRDKLPFAFEDRGEQQVKNIARPLRVYVLKMRDAAPKADHAPVLALPGKPSIAVLPFNNMSGDPEQEYFADGVVEEIIAALSRVRSLFVIARNSTFTYKGRAIDVRQISRELGVRYILEGSVRRGNRRVRVTAQLLDGTDGSHIWADRYDGELEDIFDLQDQLTSAIVGAIQPSIRSHEIERARRKRPDSLDAYDYVMRAMPTVWSNNPEAVAQGLALVELAIERDPSYALAKAIGSWCHAQQIIYLRSTNPTAEKQRALALAQEAAGLDSNDPLVLTALSAAYTLVKRLDLAASFIEKALLLDPNSAWAWQRSGWLNMYLGKPEVSIDHFNRGLRLSPLDPLNFNSYVGIGAAHSFAQRYDKAVEWLEKALRERPEAVWAHRTLAAAYANAGRMDEARASVTILRQAYPNVTISQVQEVIPGTADYMSRLTDVLRKAGLPE